MDIDNRKNDNRPLIISIVITVFFLIIGIVVHIINDKGNLLTFRSLGEMFAQNTYLWILIAQAILIPVAVYVYDSFQKKLFSQINSELNTQNKKTKSVTKYIEHLIQEVYTEELVGFDSQDKLAKSLINLRDTLKNNKKIVDKQRNEDENRNWHAEGHAKFGAILRDNSSFENLAFNVIKELTNYVNAIQGAFYHLEEEKKQKYFNLIAHYAYGRKKFADKKILWGKGLIGSAALEKKTIIMDKIPQGYLTVTSGLGHTNPDNLIVAPLVYENELFGVLEIASLNEFTEDQINFIEKVAESIASTLSTVQMNLRTTQLLKESKQQAQALASQEEEMRQNMEELKATQEEAARQSERFLQLETTVNHTMIRAEYNKNGVLQYANTNFLDKLEYTSNSQVEGKHISMFISKKDEEWFNSIWENIKEGGKHFEGYMKHITKTGKDLWTIATYTGVRDENGDCQRILFLALDTTEQKKISLNLESLMDALNRSSLKIEFDINGNITNYSESVLYLFNFSEKDIEGMNVFELIDRYDLEVFNKKWENIVNGMNFEGQFKVRTKEEKESWMQGAFSAVFNMYEEVDKVIFIGHDITKQKFMEIEFKNQNEVLKKQEFMLRESEKDLSLKLREAKEEMQEQFKEIERIKIRNERTLEGALDAIIQTTQDNKIIFYNHAAEKLLGYKAKEVLGQSIKILFSEETTTEDSFVSNYISGIDKEIGKRTEIKIKHKNGEELPVLILLSRAKVENETTYTAFIQTIEVELF